MLDHCNKIEERLEKHLDQYQNNGKEILRLAIALENITKEVRDHHKFSEDNKMARIKEEQTFKAELKPMLDSYYALINGRKIVLGLIITVSAIGSLYLLLKQIFK